MSSASSLQPVRIGLVGAGRMARTRVANIAAGSDAVLVAVASRTTERARTLAAEAGCTAVDSVDTLLARDDLDAVVVATNNESHAAIALAALESGRHVLVEYPLALLAHEADRVSASARHHGLVLRVGYDQTHLGLHAALAALIEQDGPPLELVVRVAWGGRSPTAFRTIVSGGPPGLVKSYYLFAVLDWLGLPASSQSRLRIDGLAPDDGSYSAAVQHVSLAYEKTLVQVSWLVGPDVGGQRRDVSIEATWPRHKVVVDGGALRRRDDVGETVLPFARRSWAEATRLGLTEFVAATRRPSDDPRTTLAAVTVLLATANE